MSRRPFIPYAAALGDVLHPGDPRSPAMKSRCKRAVETLIGEWSPRGRSGDVAWCMLHVLALESARRVNAWAGSQQACRVIGELGVRLRGYAGRPHAPIGTGEAPAAAIAQCRGLYDQVAALPRVVLPPAKLAWALLIAVLEEAWVRFGPEAAAELATLALEETLPPNRTPPRHVQEARP